MANGWIKTISPAYIIGLMLPEVMMPTEVGRSIMVFNIKEMAAKNITT